MPEGNKGYSYINKLYENLDEYSKNRLEHQLDIYSDVRIEPERATINCRFKDTCYALKSKQGNCPCELNE